MRILLSILTIFLLSTTAQASLCNLEAEVSGKSWHFIVGHSELSGDGQINCFNNESGQFEKVMDVYVEAEGAGFGLGYTKINKAKLYSTGLGIIESSESLLGDFLFAKSGVHIGPVGADVAASIFFNARKGESGFAIPFALDLKSGKGLELSVLDFMNVRVTPIDL